MKVDLEHLSRLANLELTEEERKLLPGQMEKIIDWVGQLSSLATGEEEKYHQVDFSLRLEEDEVQPSLPQDEVLAMAPEKQGDFVKVPRVFREK
ncbi:MAG: Aspartyl-tRNA(Asn) amidotransferase subunit C [Candidatus Saccharicenans subterraneus]|uniref:Aspartyl/glutamyl-tRNA(Asn/Gln) amidotransferase subunit C n=1 Tax=Candidatus Saccharicenans subterraneus TaxID=2508984 RepID=A0A3E2BQB5_9BACT|nr:MAG: Aspartyl-tRNA(Asn) amidotransferase subunit C [Candidatus Saccharicenans subterraneum]